jgi:hypothetical protein
VFQFGNNSSTDDDTEAIAISAGDTIPYLGISSAAIDLQRGNLFATINGAGGEVEMFVEYIDAA